MARDAEIVERNGELFVLENWQNDFSKPIKYRTAWPTGLRASQYPHFICKKCVLNGTGVAKIDDGGYIRLKSGAHTTPEKDYCEERYIKQHPWAHKYRNGRWVR